jgi:hypothetical protein
MPTRLPQIRNERASRLICARHIHDSIWHRVEDCRALESRLQNDAGTFSHCRKLRVSNSNSNHRHGAHRDRTTKPAE